VPWNEQWCLLLAIASAARPWSAGGSCDSQSQDHVLHRDPGLQWHGTGNRGPPGSASARGPARVAEAHDPEIWDIGYGGTPEDAWENVWVLADQRGLIRHDTVGGAPCHCFRARSVVGIYRHWRETEPYGLYGVPKPVT
jgi:hypothetical protein